MGLLEDIKRRRDRAKLTKKKRPAKGRSARKFSKAELDKIADMTHNNDHAGARAFIAKKMGWTKMCKAIEAAGLLRDVGYLGVGTGWEGYGFKISPEQREQFIDLGNKAQDAVMRRLRKEHPEIEKRVNESL